MTYLFQYSGFGYNRRAIQGNQKLAHDAGINIYKNAFLCYVAAGALVAIAGVFDTAYKSSLVPVLGMNSNSTVFANMFPMAVGVWLAKKSNPVVGILAGSLSVQFLILGLAKFTAIGVSDYMQNLHQVQRMADFYDLPYERRQVRPHQSKACTHRIGS